tara:strand:- start:42 stop:194 length:153 start_codon:yes stop_codon:yes gene_type:complete
MGAPASEPPPDNVAVVPVNIGAEVNVGLGEFGEVGTSNVMGSGLGSSLIV